MRDRSANSAAYPHSVGHVIYNPTHFYFPLVCGASQSLHCHFISFILRPDYDVARYKVVIPVRPCVRACGHRYSGQLQN